MRKQQLKPLAWPMCRMLEQRGEVQSRQRSNIPIRLRWESRDVLATSLFQVLLEKGFSVFGHHITIGLVVVARLMEVGSGTREGNSYHNRLSACDDVTRA